MRIDTVDTVDTGSDPEITQDSNVSSPKISSEFLM